VCVRTSVRLIWRENRLTSATMVGLIFLFFDHLVFFTLQSRADLKAE